MGGRSSLLAYEDDDEDKAPSALAAYESDDDAPDMDFSSTPLDVPEAAPKSRELSLLESLLGGRKFVSDESLQAAGGPLGAQPIEDMAEAVVGTNMGGPLKVADKTSGFLAGAGNMGKSAINEAFSGATQAALDELGNGATPQQLLESVLQSAGGGAAADAVLGLAGKITKGLGGAASFLGRKADNTKAGGNMHSREALIEKFGIEGGPDMLGELIRKYSPSGLFSPKTSAGHLANIEKQLADESIHRADAIRAAGDEGADAAMPAVWDQAQNDILDKTVAAQRSGLSKTRAGAGRELEATFNRMTDDVDAPRMIEDLIGYKSQLGEEAFERGIAGSIEDTAAGQAAGQGWRTLRDAENSALAEASPYTEFSALDAEKTYSELAGLQDVLRPRANADDAMGGAGTAAVGALAGAMMPGGQGLMGAMTSGTNNAVRQMTGGVAHDLFSNVMHPTGAALKGVGGAMQNVPTGSFAADASQAGAERDGRGHLAGERIGLLLKNNPTALGRFAAEFEGMEGDAIRIKQKISQLSDEEEDFRSMMRQLTARQR